MAWKLGMETRHFRKVVLRMKLFLSLYSFNCHIVNIRVSFFFHGGFYSCRYQNQNFSLVSHSCCSCCTSVVLVLLVLHSCCIRDTRVALVLLVPGTRAVNKTRSQNVINPILQKTSVWVTDSNVLCNYFFFLNFVNRAGRIWLSDN